MTKPTPNADTLAARAEARAFAKAENERLKGFLHLFRTDENMTYTVMRLDGDVQDRHLSMSEAAECVLRHDSFDFEIRHEPEDGVWTLWVTPYSRASGLGSKPMVKTPVYSLRADEPAATAEIYEKVLRVAERWKCSVQDDASYDAEMAALARENAEE